MEERERKRWLWGTAALALVMLGLAWSGEEAPAPAVARDAPAEAPGKAEPREGRWKILGTEEASKEQALKDPFSLSHRERGSAVENAEAPEESPAPMPVKTPERNPPVEKSGTEKEEKAVKWALKGILSGAEERLAIVSNGKETRTVGVGETFGDRVVTAIGEDSLSFSDAAGGGELHLPGF